MLTTERLSPLHIFQEGSITLAGPLSEPQLLEVCLIFTNP